MGREASGRVDATKARDGNGRLHVLFVHPSDELYGSDRVLLELLRGLDRTRFAPVVVLSSDVPYAGRLSHRLAALGIPVERLRLGALRRAALATPRGVLRFAFDTLRAVARLARLIERERIEIVHANTVTVPAAAVAALLTRRPLVWHLHEIVPDRFGKGVLLAFARALADRLVVVSEAARRALGATGRRAEVVPNGVDAARFDAAAASPPADPPLVAFLGRLSTRKGPDVLLRAASRLAPRHPAVRFVFQGDEFGGGDAHRRALADAASRLGLAGRVELRPFQEDVSGLLAEASVVVAPSIQPESFGLVALEAMAAARPVVASDDGGLRELVVPGETGFVFPPGDDAALAGHLDRLLADPALARRLGAAGRRRAAARYALAASVARFSSMYRELARAEAAEPFREESAVPS